MDHNPLTLLPARARKIVYGIYGGLSLAGVGVAAYYAAVPTLTVPDFVVGGLAVLGSLAPAFTVLATSNIQPDQPVADGTMTIGGDAPESRGLGNSL